MTICIFKHLKYRYSQFKWNKLTSLKCISPQFIHLILAGFIATNLIFSRDHVLNKLNVSSKKKAKRKTSNCLVLPCDGDGLFTGQLFRRRKLKSSWALILTEIVAEAFEFPASDRLRPDVPISFVAREKGRLRNAVAGNKGNRRRLHAGNASDWRVIDYNT